MHRTRIVTLCKVQTTDGELLGYSFPHIGRGRAVDDFISKDRVPPFEGDRATFELEKVREPRCPWPRWRVIRRVD